MIQSISFLVESRGYYRMMTSNVFSIRNLVLQALRYNPYIRIMAIGYGVPTMTHSNNKEWLKLDNSQVHEDISRLKQIPYPKDFSKEYLLTNYDYRSAVNLYYVWCANNRIYPIKNPFKGVKIDDVLPDLLAEKYGYIKFQTFVQDEANVFENKANILNYYEGQRVDRMWRGNKVSGFILTKCRYNGKEVNHD